MADDFDESWYLQRYPDVAKAVQAGTFKSGRAHFDNYGKAEGRRPAAPPPWPYEAIPPQRYMDNFHRYLNRGGLLRPDQDVLGFVHRQNANRHDMARFYFFCLAFDQIVKERLSGDLAEVGVWKGNTAILLRNMACRLDRTVYLFDTFEGFDKADLAGVDAHQKVQFNDTSLEVVKRFVGEDHVHYAPGYFPDTAVQLPEDKQFCLVHIDCDLYRPILSALEVFYPRLVPGGFMIIHDYSSLHWQGAENAIDEFFADKPEAVIPLTDAAGSAVIRRCRT